MRGKMTCVRYQRYATFIIRITKFTNNYPEADNNVTRRETSPTVGRGKIATTVKMQIANAGVPPGRNRYTYLDL